MCSPLYASLFRGLVKQLGGVDAACAVIEAALGHSVSRGSVSRIQNGQAEVPVSWAFALEDASGNRCFTRHRNRQVEAQVIVADEVGHLDVLRESSEMIMALGRAEASEDANTLSAALKETLEVADMAGAKAQALQARLDLLGLEAAS
ncbi:hypothetical protein [Puniceibacterium confluentis]|uniref:hypothetical protein n=1 Tax=Puniceibacterium confluentis TaxID=1958944 RepID=UPI0035613260